ncbi:alpha/beta hydrolase [Flavihumibacter sp.]|uniref:alpha/beta hydrolase n=1 Tax=Flavihumibacter sp. TaxID=1913981 RepID=UPI002FC74E7B
MHKKNIVSAGKPLPATDKVLVLLHGRGGSAEDILGLADHLSVKDFALLAPQATNNSWYPYSFMAPVEQNEPWLSSALSLLEDLVKELKASGKKEENIFFGGFSQGACLTLEFVTRNAARYGGVIAFTGGLIGEKINPENYKGDFAGTPVFIGTSDPDMHVPVARVYASSNILRDMNAAVVEKVYPGMGHTISGEEVLEANKLLEARV